MKDLNQELRRVNLQLASLSRLAHELHTTRFGSNAPADERKRINEAMLETERQIGSATQERKLILRAIKYETLASEDNEGDSPTIETVAQADEALSHNGNGVKVVARRKPGRPRKTAAPAAEAVGS